MKLGVPVIARNNAGYSAVIKHQTNGLLYSLPGVRTVCGLLGGPIITIIITGALNKDGVDFLSDLGRRITLNTNDHRESAFLFQQLSVLIQRYNVVSWVPSPTQPTIMKCSRSSICYSF